MTNPLMAGMSAVPANPTVMTGGLNLTPEAQEAIASVKRMKAQVMSAQNPSAVLRQAATQSPMLANMLNMCQCQSPEAIVRASCQAHGVDPMYVLNLIR